MHIILCRMSPIRNSCCHLPLEPFSDHSSRHYYNRDKSYIWRQNKITEWLSNLKKLSWFVQNWILVSALFTHLQRIRVKWSLCTKTNWSEHRMFDCESHNTREQDLCFWLERVQMFHGRYALADSCGIASSVDKKMVEMNPDHFLPL